MPKESKPPSPQDSKRTESTAKPTPSISSNSATSLDKDAMGLASLSRLTTAQGQFNPEQLLKQMTPPEQKALLDELRSASASLRGYSDLLKRKLEKETLTGFMEQVIQWPEEITYMPRLDHIQEWVRLVETHDKLLVEASRDHFKSTFFSFALPLYWVSRVKDPRDAFGIAMFAYSDTQSQKYIKRIRQEIENNPQLKWLLPKSKSSVWDSTTLDMSNGCWIESYGFGSSFRGRHPKKVLVDDACKDSGTGAMSLDQQIQFFSGVIIPAVKKKGQGQIIVTGNPVDKIDFLGYLEENKAFTFRKYPALNDKDEPLAPRHYDRAAIEDKRASIPTHIFAREYMLKRVSSADARFKPEWITYYKPEDHRIDRDHPGLGDVPLYKVMTIDPALSPNGDYLAAIVTGCTNSGYVDVVDSMRFRGDLDVGVGRLVDMMVANQPDYIGFEVFAFQSIYKTLLEREIKRRGLYFFVDEVGRDSKKKKAARIESLQPALAKRTLRFRKEDAWLVEELLLWDPISKTNQDDGIDALAWQVPLWRKPGESAVPARSAPVPGSFNEAFEKIRMAGHDSSYIAKLFSDFQGNS
jgi:hypothetical protein